MKHATSIALHSYWLTCQQPLGVPAGEIRAAELAPILPALFLIDLDVAAGLRVRFCGATVAMRYGRDLTNESFLALWNTADRQALEQHVKALATRSTGMVAGAIGETLGGGFTSFEFLLLPLRSASGASGAIGSMARIGGHEEMNRIRARLVSQDLRSVRFLYSRPGERLDRRVAEELRPGEPHTLKHRRYGHLTLVSGGA